MSECPQCGYHVEAGPPANVTFVYATRMVYFRKYCVKLTHREMEIFEHLYDAGRRGCTTTELCDAIYADRGEDVATPNETILAVHLSNMRRKLRVIGVGINSTGRGAIARYSLNIATVNQEQSRCSMS